MTDSNSTIYVVADGRIASSSKDGKDYHEGEVIDLSHLSNAQIANLINIGLVVVKSETQESNDDDN